MAAIIGKTFSFKLLEAIYPVQDTKESLLEHLVVLRKLGIINNHSDDDGKLNCP